MVEDKPKPTSKRPTKFERLLTSIHTTVAAGGRVDVSVKGASFNHNGMYLEFTIDHTDIPNPYSENQSVGVQENVPGKIPGKIPRTCFSSEVIHKSLGLFKSYLHEAYPASKTGFDYLFLYGNQRVVIMQKTPETSLEVVIGSVMETVDSDRHMMLKGVSSESDEDKTVYHFEMRGKKLSISGDMNPTGSPGELVDIIQRSLGADYVVLLGGNDIYIKSRQAS